jgi:hypothetical protein
VGPGYNERKQVGDDGEDEKYTYSSMDLKYKYPWKKYSVMIGK